MRTSAIILAVTLVSSVAPSLAAPVPVSVNAGTSSDLQARAGASAIVKPFLKSAGSSAAIAGLLGVLSKFTGGNDKKAEKRALPKGVSKEVTDLVGEIFGEITGKVAANAALGKNIDGSPKSRRDAELAERAGASALLKPFLKSAASSAAVGGFFGALNKLFGGDNSQRRSVQDLDVDNMISMIENSGALTQEQLDEVETELTKSLSSVQTRSLDIRAVKVGGLTKGLLGILGSVAGSFGVDAVFGNNNRRAAPLTLDDMIATIEKNSGFSQAQLDKVEAELSKAMTGGLTSRSNLEVRAVKLGGLTKGLVGIIGSLAGSLGVDAVFGNDNSARSYEGLNALD